MTSLPSHIAASSPETETPADFRVRVKEEHQAVAQRLVTAARELVRAHVDQGELFRIAQRVLGDSKTDYQTFNGGRPFSLLEFTTLGSEGSYFDRLKELQAALVNLETEVRNAGIE
jgi:hypothetical protein